MGMSRSIHIFLSSSFIITLLSDTRTETSKKMFKLVVLAVALSTYGVLANPEAKAEAKPGVLAAAPLLAPAVAPAIVTAQSSQVFIRKYNALAAPLVAAPVAAASPYVAAPYIASPYVSPYTAPYFAAPYLI